VTFLVAQKGGLVSVSGSQNGSVNSRSGLLWIQRYSELVRFTALRGGLPRELVQPQGPEEVAEQRLGGWVRYQRRREERGMLPAWQRELLEQLPEFTWDPLGDQWDQWLEQLRTFLETERRVPRYRTEQTVERALAAWVHKQRFLYKREALTPYRAEALRSLPFKIL
jgi:hypothetical protein